jgi:hypothetical protein
MAAAISSAVAPQFEHSVAVKGFLAPHFGQVMSMDMDAGLKHIQAPILETYWIFLSLREDKYSDYKASVLDE